MSVDYSLLTAADWPPCMGSKCLPLALISSLMMATLGHNRSKVRTVQDTPRVYFSMKLFPRRRRVRSLLCPDPKPPQRPRIGDPPSLRYWPTKQNDHWGCFRPLEAVGEDTNSYTTIVNMVVVFQSAFSLLGKSHFPRAASYIDVICHSTVLLQFWDISGIFLQFWPIMIEKLLSLAVQPSSSWSSIDMVQ